MSFNILSHQLSYYSEIREIKLLFNLMLSEMPIKVKFTEDGVVYAPVRRRIRECGMLEIGQRVHCLYSDGRWYEARILEIESGERYSNDSLTMKV